MFNTTNKFKSFTTKRLTKLSVHLSYGFLHARKLFIEGQDGWCNYYVCFKEILVIEKFTKIVNETRQNKERWPSLLRQNLTPILHNIEICSNECRALVKHQPQGFVIITCTLIRTCHNYYERFCCSFTHLRGSRLSPQCFLILPLTLP